MSKTFNLSARGGVGQGLLVPLFLGAAIIILGLSGWAWWHSIRSNPERTLHAAIENNFRTRSVTREVVQDGGTQKLEQSVELSLSPDVFAHGRTAISQSGEVDAMVETETISTPEAEFVRYTNIQTNQKNKKGSELDFKDLLDVWGKSSAEQTGQPGELYGESVLGIIPTASLNASDRRALMKTVRDNNVYQFDDKTLERKIVDGRPTYIYDITVAPTAYITLLKQFGGMVGLRQLEGLDPSQYENSQPLVFKLTVDVWSQRLTGVEFAGGERTELTSGFGIDRDVVLPKETIPVQELQAKLQQVQQ